VNKKIKEYLASIGAKGGSVSSEAKKKASAETLKKARAALKKKREKNDP
jgi:hypothetical protein